MSDLIDTTEMYLRTVFELQEEGVAPLRARIAERLNQSGPTVSQTVGRMERDGLLVVRPDRQIELTAKGMSLATRVMRKHRLAERLLLDVIGLPWEEVHAEACRWEHVISESVERRLLELLDGPTQSPFGNPIPGLAELDPRARRMPLVHTPTLASAAGPQERRMTLARIAEPLQENAQVMRLLRRIGAEPGAVLTVSRRGAGVLVRGEVHECELTAEQAAQIHVEV